jgi:hypothetical protein
MTVADQHTPVTGRNEPDEHHRRPARCAQRPDTPTVAATVVLFLERIRQEAGPRPIAVWEWLG